MPSSKGRVTHEELLQFLPATGERRVLVLDDARDSEEEQKAEPADVLGDPWWSLNLLGQKRVRLLGAAELVQRELAGALPAGEDRVPRRCALHRRINSSMGTRFHAATVEPVQIANTHDLSEAEIVTEWSRRREPGYARDFTHLRIAKLA